MTEIQNTLFIGRKLFVFDTLPSTNTWLTNKYIPENLPEGTIVLTRNQTEGRGQRGNKWFSKPGQSLTFSLLLYPRILNPEKQFVISQAIALAIHDLLVANKIPEPSVKWPNDIMSQEYKIGGVLIENSLRGDLFQSSIIGIGLNINQNSFPIELPNASSFKLSTGLDYQTTKLMEDLCQYIEKRYMQIRTGKIKELETEYLAKMYRKKNWHSFETWEGKFNGKISGISAFGKIQIIKEDGETHEYSTKEIKFL